MTPEVLQLAWPAMAFLALVVLYGVGPLARARYMLARWARSEGFRVLDTKRRVFNTGPFVWAWLGHAVVFWVVLEDREHRRRSGWVKCGRYWGGLLSNNVEVAWQDSSLMTMAGPIGRDRFV
jgi:hypothetical protein